MASISSVVGSGRISRDDGYWNRWVNSGVGEPVSKALFPAKCNCIISSSFRQRRTPSFFSDTTSFSLSNLKLENSIVKQLHVPSAKEVKTAQIEAPEKPKVPAKAPAKAPAKPLPQMMEEDVIPSLKAILQNQDDLSDLDLFFQDNRLEGSFVKKGIPYSFWAFFPSGVLTGPKGFSLTSYGSEASTVEPFLIDEKKITAKHVVFWVEKRLAAQGIIPVWKD